MTAEVGDFTRPVYGLAALVVLMTLFACGSPDPSADHERIRGLLDQRQDEFSAALAAGDPEGMAALHAEDAVIHVAERNPIEGREAVLSFYQNLFGFMSASTLTPESTRISDAGDMAFSVGSTSNEFRGPEGTVAYSGKYLLIWTRRADDWLVSVYAVSGNQASDE